MFGRYWISVPVALLTLALMTGPAQAQKGGAATPDGKPAPADADAAAKPAAETDTTVKDIYANAKIYLDSLDGGALIPKPPYVPKCATPEAKKLLAADYAQWRTGYADALAKVRQYMVMRVLVARAQADLDKAKQAEVDAATNLAFAKPSEEKAGKAALDQAKKDVASAQRQLQLANNNVSYAERDMNDAVVDLRGDRTKQLADEAKAKNACPPPETPSTVDPRGQETPKAPMPGHTSSGGGGCSDGVLAQVNAMRVNPSAYADMLVQYRTYYHGNLVSEPGHPQVMTHEGVAAVDSAISYLRGRMPVPPLAFSSALARSASRLVTDIGPKGGASHIGSDGSTLRTRMQGAGVQAAIMEEDLSLMQPAPVGIVRQLAIDDGVPMREHLGVLMNPSLTIAGAACGPNKTWGSMAVIDFAGALMAPPPP
jgi:uncharacterized protein YkwD